MDWLPRKVSGAERRAAGAPLVLRAEIAGQRLEPERGRGSPPMATAGLRRSPVPRRAPSRRRLVNITSRLYSHLANAGSSLQPGSGRAWQARKPRTGHGFGHGRPRLPPPGGVPRETPELWLVSYLAFALALTFV